MAYSLFTLGTVYARNGSEEPFENCSVPVHTAALPAFLVVNGFSLLSEQFQNSSGTTKLVVLVCNGRSSSHYTKERFWF